jgi:hypothetical protein
MLQRARLWNCSDFYLQSTNQTLLATSVIHSETDNLRLNAVAQTMKVSHCTVTHHSNSATICLFSQDSDWWTILYLYVFFWVIPRHLNFIRRRFRTLSLFHLHRQVGVEWLNLRIQKKNIQHTEHGKSLKSRILHLYEEGTVRHIRLFLKLCIT